MDPAPQRALGPAIGAAGTALMVAATEVLVAETHPVAVILDCTK